MFEVLFRFLPSSHFVDLVNQRMLASPPFVVSLVHLVYLVGLVYLVCFVA
jgi:hypothetical protein